MVNETHALEQLSAEISKRLETALDAVSHERTTQYNLVQRLSVISSQTAELRSSSNVQTVQSVMSFRRFLRPLVIRFRQLSQAEIRWTVDPIVHKQVQFNLNVSRILGAMAEFLSEHLNYVGATMGRLASRTRDHQTLIEELASRTRDHQTLIDAFSRPGNWNYLAFEDRYRGSEEQIRERQRKYLEFYQGCKNVLDVGCGRGEFLELLRESGMRGHGVELDDGMASHARRKNLSVVSRDALEYLRSLPDESLDGVFVSQVMEHLRPKQVYDLLKLSYQKLQKGSSLVIETVNPLTLGSFNWIFYLDPSHVFPLHPETLEFFLEQVGFRDIRRQLLSQSPEDQRLRKVPTKARWGAGYKEIAGVLNENVQKLNDLLFGYSEYAVIARK